MKSQYTKHNKSKSKSPQAIASEAAVAYVPQFRILEPLELLAFKKNRSTDAIENTADFINYIREGIPKLDTSMSIAMLMEELGRIEHGIFA